MNRKEKLKALQEKMKACEKCPNVERRVIVEGDIEDWLMVIGQAPARHRTDPHRPFSQGNGGRKLFRWMEEAGLGNEEEFRTRAYFTAVARCYPGPGKNGHGDEPPSKEQLANCAPFLDQELELVRPVVIIPVGKMAIERSAGRKTLAEAVGKSFRVEFKGWSSIVVPFPHPSGASLWNNLPENKALVQKAVEILAELQRQHGD